MKPYYDRGGITIYCGDCLEVMPQLDITVDAIICDPPYGINRDIWDNPVNVREFFEIALKITKEFLTIFGQMPTLADWHMAAIQKGISLVEHVIWIKRNSTPGGNENRLKRGHESIYIYTINDNRVFYELKGPYEDVKLPGLLFDVITIQSIDRYIKSLMLKNKRGYGSIIPETNRQSAAYKDLKGGYETSSHFHNYTNVWSFLPPSLKTRDGTRHHPTEKPIAIMGRLVKMTSDKNGLILDPFMGSGTTLLAARAEGRRAIGIDIDEHWCKVTVERLSNEKTYSLPNGKTYKQVSFLPDGN